MTPTQEQFSVVLAILELPHEDVQFLEDLTHGDLAYGLAEFKKLVKRRRKALALKYHPDITKDDGEKMKRINDAVDFVMGMKVVRRSEPMRFVYNPTSATTFNATATFDASFNRGAFRTFFDQDD